LEFNKNMKNLFILPTDKPSRLLVRNDKPFVLMLKEHSPFATNQTHTYQHIYITNSEEIKEGDWYINTFVNEKEQKPQTHTEKRHLINHQKDYRFKYCKKIILTTDQDLVKNGVQAIDDEFLEWFVKNPSCEKVEVDRDEREVGNHLGGVVIEYGGYKIIIPKEEPKKLYDLPLAVNNVTMSFTSKPKQETLEEAFKKWADKQNAYDKFDVLRFGAKWQAERMYSEEEVRNIVEQTIEKFYKHRYVETKSEMKELWFEQFKKK
jgi:hypothetical protein